MERYGVRSMDFLFFYLMRGYAYALQRYLLVVLFAGCVWPLTFWWFGRLGRR